jgi:Lipopolysaccharide-assembly
MWRSGLASLLLVASACFPYGFAGGGLPSHVRTIAILPFENETSTPDLPRQLQEQMRRTLRNRLGLREASEAKADAVVRGTITRYDVDVPIGYSTDPNARPVATRRKLQILVDVEIVDQSDGKTLWQRKGLTADGDYDEGAEQAGRRIAVEKLVNDVVQGAQSQW